MTGYQGHSVTIQFTITTTYIALYPTAGEIISNTGLQNYLEYVHDSLGASWSEGGSSTSTTVGNSGLTGRVITPLRKAAESGSIPSSSFKPFSYFLPGNGYYWRSAGEQILASDYYNALVSWAAQTWPNAPSAHYYD